MLFAAIAINSNVLLTTHMASSEWETYPVNVDCFVPLSEDRLGYRARLAEISTLLFSSGQDQLEVLSVVEGDESRPEHYHWNSSKEYPKSSTANTN
jgi:hypothetical protein